MCYDSGIDTAAICNVTEVGIQASSRLAMRWTGVRCFIIFEHIIVCKREGSTEFNRQVLCNLLAIVHSSVYTPVLNFSQFAIDDDISCTEIVWNGTFYLEDESEYLGKYQ